MSFEKINVKLLDEYEKKFSDLNTFILVDNSAMDVKKSEDFRKDLYKSEARLFVGKNRILQLLFKNKGYRNSEKINGSRTSVVLIRENPLKVLKIIQEYEKKKDSLSVKNGLFEGVFIDIEDIKKLTKIPSKEFLLSKLCFVIKSPIQNFHGVLKGTLQNAVGVIRAIKDKKENSES